MVSKHIKMKHWTVLPLITIEIFFCRVEVLPFDTDLVHETLEGDFNELYDDEDDSNGW